MTDKLSVADDWIEWNGGECPIPDDDTVHEVQWRDGSIYADQTEASAWRWSHKGFAADIIAYRLARERGL